LSVGLRVRLERRGEVLANIALVKVFKYRVLMLSMAENGVEIVPVCREQRVDVQALPEWRGSMMTDGRGIGILSREFFILQEQVQ